MATMSHSPPVDWNNETTIPPMAHMYKVEVPGLMKEDLSVEVDDEGRLLKITGKISAGNKFKRKSGKFVKNFTLPHNNNNAMLFHVKAKLEHGVLTVIVFPSSSAQGEASTSSKEKLPHNAI